MGPEHVYGGLIESHVATYLRDHLAATRDSVGVLAPLLLFIPAEYAHALGLFLWDL